MIFVGVVDWMLFGLESEEFVVNVNFDGIIDFNLIGVIDMLILGEEGVVYIMVKVVLGGFVGLYENSVFGNFILFFGMIVNDVLQNGSNFDFDGDGDFIEYLEEMFVSLECFVDIICLVVIDIIIVDNDLGWCQVVVNFFLVEIVICVGVLDSLIEFKLLGVGVMDYVVDEWLFGQFSGLMYNVGLMEVLICISVFFLLMLGYFDICFFFICVNDKEILVIFCCDIIVLVGSFCEYNLILD